MKKLLSIAFIMMGMIFAVSSADAQGRRDGPNNRGNQKPAPNRRVEDKQIPNRRVEDRQIPNRGRGVQIYTETKLVRKGRKFYRETYQIKVFKNGRRTSKLISRVQVNARNRRGDRDWDRYDREDGPYGRQAVIRTFYETETLWEGGRKYRVTYKITEYRNGEFDSDIVNKVRI